MAALPVQWTLSILVHNSSGCHTVDYRVASGRIALKQFLFTTNQISLYSQNNSLFFTP